MSIRIKGLTKTYGQQHAVNNISFEVEEGEIVGFLGPNGAGKSTTMKIATGYLPATSGTVEVADFDVLQKPNEVRKNIGYLPEHNPLYLDMYVHEYLHFSGGVYGLSGKKLKERVKEVVQLCGLTREQNKLIGALSKGYRQRVGLAQALIHDPKVLILDEPTTGLDPNQIVEIRELIKSVSTNKTVLFSSHIMQEVQALCKRAVIIKKGELVADQEIEQLTNTSETFTISMELSSSSDLQVLHAMEEVLEIKQITEMEFLLKAKADIRKEIFKIAADNEIDLVGLRLEKGNMEEVFQRLTRD